MEGVQELSRLFRFKKGKDTITLDDPNPAFTPTETIKFFSVQYPELTTATVGGPKIEGAKLVFDFTTTVGTKG